MAPACDPDIVDAQLEAMALVAAGDAAGGPMARLQPAERFHWLAAPSSTVIQPSPVHTGVTSGPEATLESLFRQLVA